MKSASPSLALDLPANSNRSGSVCIHCEISGKLHVAISDLTGPGKIAADSIKLGYVSNRLTRVSGDGAVYTIAPRFVVPRDTIDARRNVAREFWLTVHPTDDTPAGLYRGEITLTPEHGQPQRVPVEYRVYPGTLDPVDVPVGPWSHEIGIPWDASDPAAQAWNQTMSERSLRKLKEYGFTTFSGLPRLRLLGWKDSQPQIDFSEGRPPDGACPPRGVHDARGNVYQLRRAESVRPRRIGAMQAAGFNDYSQYIKAIFSAVQEHAESG